MKKLTLIVAFLALLQSAQAGGLLTNANQSAQYIRMLSRNASLGIDAVYFNPAGLIKLEDGWHFAAFSQTIFQEKTVDSAFPLLNDGSYVGKVEVPVFPTAFAVYKMDDWAFSLGFGPNAGGGSAEFENGLPAFEIPISQTRTLLSQLGVSGYDVDLYFKGSSVFWGIQLGATYEINENIAVYGGVRYLPSKNVYEGYIRDIQLDVAGAGMVPATGYLTQAAGMMQSAAAMPDVLAPFLEAGGSYTLAELQGAGLISATQQAQIAAGLGLMDIPQAQIEAMNLTQIHGAYTQAKPQFEQQAASLSSAADNMQDKNVNTEQTGNAFTPIVGLNLTLNDDWNIALKYEMKTFLTLDNEPKEDSNYDLWGDEVNSDIPAVLTAGIGYRGLDWLEAQLSYNLYFDKGVDWGRNVNDIAVWADVDGTKIRSREIDNNYYELGLGLQFNVADNFAFSVGGLRSKSGIAESWQNDLSFSNSSYTLGGGIMWNVTDELVLDAGVSNTFYEDDDVAFDYPGYPDLSGSPITSYSNTYGKSTLNIAVGLSYSIF